MALVALTITGFVAIASIYWVSDLRVERAFGELNELARKMPRQRSCVYQF